MDLLVSRFGAMMMFPTVIEPLVDHELLDFHGFPTGPFWMVIHHGKLNRIQTSSEPGMGLVLASLQTATLRDPQTQSFLCLKLPDVLRGYQDQHTSLVGFRRWTQDERMKAIARAPNAGIHPALCLKGDLQRGRSMVVTTN